MIVVGLDPGQHGGVGVVIDETKIAAALPMPILDKKVDVRQLHGWLEVWDPDLVVIERQSIMNGQRGAMAIGANYGRLFAVVELLELPHKTVEASVWNRKAGIKSGLKGLAKKHASYATCMQTWGKEFSSRNIGKSNDGVYEALLIARYGC